VIAHLDLDAFYASVELRRRPELVGRPVIVSGSGPRAVVTTATYEARAFGVHSAMPTTRARRLCPDAVLVPPDFDAYRRASSDVWSIVCEHIELVEQAGLDEGYLDLGELVAPKAAMRRLLADIRERTGLSASVGIGPNKLVAKVASDLEKPAGLVLLSREEACERFADASPGLVPGIGPRTTERLAALGLPTLRALREADPALLRAHFGENTGPHLQARAAFHGATELTLDRELKSQSSERTFDYDLADAQRQREILSGLARDLFERLERRGLRGRNVAIKVRLDDWTTVTRARTLERPCAAADELARLAVELLDAYAPARPVRLLGVRVGTFVADAQAPAPEAQLSLGL
jgi:DNA polymerase-4